MAEACGLEEDTRHLHISTISVSGALFIVKMAVRPDGNDLRLALTESTK